MKSTLAVLVFAFVAAPEGSVRNIPYEGGTHSGTFRLTILTDPYMDTAVAVDSVYLEGDLLVTRYLADTTHEGSPCFPSTREYGVFVVNGGGSAGKQEGQGTEWEEATVFPDSLLPLEPIPANPGYGINQDLGTDPRGMKLGEVPPGTLCDHAGFNVDPDYRDVIYFLIQNPPDTIYGKMAMYHHEPTTSLPVDQPGRVFFAYTLSDTRDLNDTSFTVGISRTGRPPPGTAPQRMQLHGNGVLLFDPGRPGVPYDLTGKRRGIREPMR